MIAPVLAVLAGVLLLKARKASAANVGSGVPGVGGGAFARVGELFALLPSLPPSPEDLGVEFKAGVKLNLSPRMAAALPVIDQVTKRELGRGAVITSGTDGRHSTTSKHYSGDAIDLRNIDLGGAVTGTGKALAYAMALNSALNAAGHTYDVVIETQLKDAAGKIVRYPHIHIEVDPKPGRHGVTKI